MRFSIIFLLMVLSSFGLLAQNVGDFRTSGAGPSAWEDFDSWQVFNGTAWVNATTYPGEIAGTYDVTIRPNHTITPPPDPHFNFGKLTIRGTLNLPSNDNYILNASEVVVTENEGQINFQGNNILRLPAGTAIIVYPGGLFSTSNQGCSAAQGIEIGGNLIANCRPRGNNQPVSFNELMGAGGSLLSIINGSFPDCSQDSVNELELQATYIGLKGIDPSFTWLITAPDGSTSSPTNENITLSLLQNGVYSIELTWSTIYQPNRPYSNTRIIEYSNKTTIWNGIDWTPNPPDLLTRVAINGEYSTLNGSFSACNLKVNSSGKLVIRSEDFVEVDGSITIADGGVLEVDDSGSILQIMDDITNIGEIKYERIANNVNRFDYVYWSSPVNNFNIANIVGSGNRFYWNPLFNNTNNIQGNWISYPSGVMDVGRGYIVRAPNNYPAHGDTPSTITTNFTGVPNNGTFNIAVSRGNDNDNILDNSNLVGNPYPSAVDIADFLVENAVTNEILEGYVNLWPHNNAPSAAIANPFYGTFGYNYSSSDYITVNLLGEISGTNKDFSTIGAGQGFFVIMNEGTQLTRNIQFNNSMRTKTNNDIFFRNAANTPSNKHRIWLDVVDSQFNVSRTLIGYAEGATNEKDVLFDARKNVDTNVLNIYSLIEEEDFAIQGRALPFNEADSVPVGVNVPENGVYSVAIGKVDGLFYDQNQAIYLQDLELGIIHDLRESPYETSINQGNHKNRFVLRYTTSERLNINGVNSNSNEVAIINHPEGIKIKSVNETIQSIDVYNILGQKITSVNNVNAYELDLTRNAQTKQVSIITITLSNGQTVNRKIVF